MRATLLLVALLLGCTPTVPTESTPRPPTVTPAPTLAPTATPTPRPNYRALSNQLAGPLSSLIVAVRGNDRSTAAAFLAEFNTAGDRVVATLGTDSSATADLLRSAIVSVRRTPGDLSTLEQVRDRLMDIT